MFKFISKRKEPKIKFNYTSLQVPEETFSMEDFLIILNKIQELNNKPTPKINNWKLRQQWINTYVELAKEQIKNSEQG